VTDRTFLDDLAEEARTEARENRWVPHRCPLGSPCAQCIADVTPEEYM
jgi:hypothetical protein